MAKSNRIPGFEQEFSKAKILKDLYKKIPSAKVPGEQLASAKPNNTNSGILMEGMQLTRELEQTAMETVYNGGNINSALNTADTAMNANLKTTNKADGR